ncbi:DUF4368 domain-containing protein [Paenibacillus gansuensis]|uniref:DUF4368 domain-containing protein n=1 Tax=Paenibacillus gansuensis TaxID=306542 RepID=A0ABW5P840_9BACL
MEQFMELNELTTDMLHRLVNKIVVQTDGKVNIHYKFTATAHISAYFQ